MSGKVVKVAGPLVVAEGLSDANVSDVVRVGPQHLIGEILNMTGDKADIQVYEETGGLGPGADVITTGAPLSVELGPGMLEGIYDGIQRPLTEIRDLIGHSIATGVDVPALNRKKKWEFTATAKKGDKVVGGDVLGTVPETPTVLHKIMVPPKMKGTITKLESGSYTVLDTIGTLKLDNGEEVPLKMMQSWPVRVGRPYKRKFPPVTPLQSGQRIVDTLFPIAKGGTAAIPGPFGSGKTVMQHALAKWSDVDIVVYIGCGERGNEMTDVLNEFPELVDPHTGYPLMKRTVLIANTSDMPVAAREASIYTGITIAEYFRDMGYHVAVIADSTSRWAEALREMSGRLEEMPGEEGYPAYLASRIAQFYERAGMVECLGSDNERTGSVTAVGAVSPPGGDLSEPVSQATMRIVKVFWGLDSALAYARHFPAINWLNSYSLYLDSLKPWYEEKFPGFMANRDKAMAILQEEASLNEIVRLVGADSLAAPEQLTLATAKMIREDFLQQNSFVDIDSYSETERQFMLLGMILDCDKRSREAIAQGTPIEKLRNLPVKAQIGRAKSVPADQYKAVYTQMWNDLKAQIEEAKQGGDDE